MRIGDIWLPGVRRRATLTAAALIIAVPLPGTAEAAIPRTEIAVNGERAKGSAYTTKVGTEHSDGTCSVGHGDGIPFVDASLETGHARQRVIVTFHRADEPKALAVRIYRHLNRYDTPTGRSNLKSLTPRPLRDARDQVVGWQGRFSVRLDRPRYVTSYAAWRPDDSCGDEYGFFVYAALVPAR